MTNPTRNDVHQDRVLTSFSVRYMNNAEDYVADRAFPIVEVPNASDTYYKFKVGPWFRRQMERRAPENPYPAGDYGVEIATFLTEQWALSKFVADEVDANADEVFNLEREAAEFLASQALLEREYQFASNYMTTGVWTTDNTTATDWDATSTPIADIQTAKRTIKNVSGMTANTLIMGQIVYDALVTNADIIDVVQYTQRALPRDIGTVLAPALDLDRILVSNVVYNTAAEGLDASLSPIIDDDALLLYVPSAPSRYSAAAGLTMVWPGGGGMGMVDRVRDDMHDRIMVKLKQQFTHELVAAGLGYFFSDIV